MMNENEDLPENHWLCERSNTINDEIILNTIKEIWDYASLSSEDDLDYSDNSVEDELNVKLPGNMVVVKILRDDRTSTEGYIAKCNSEHHDCLIISFRGSKEPKDWVRNFLLIDKTSWYPYNDSSYFLKRLFQSIIKSFKSKKVEERVHKGFLSSYNSVRAQIQEYFDSESSGMSTVYVTGHSLGGSLSTLCGLDVIDLYSLEKVIMVSFGEPRPGGGKFADLLNSKLNENEAYRVVNNQDIVCRLPPWELGYRSHKFELFIDTASNVYGETDNINDYSKIEKAVENLQIKLDDNTLIMTDITQYGTDHERDSYQKALQSIGVNKPIIRKAK